ncbi:MAG: hypothetical protein CL678_08950 [Bdellovibrionaceae bacterium]|nr:hypothetical protein [Pseudobdellovibrionaceae bacterium]
MRLGLVFGVISIGLMGCGDSSSGPQRNQPSPYGYLQQQTPWQGQGLTSNHLNSPNREKVCDYMKKVVRHQDRGLDDGISYSSQTAVAIQALEESRNLMCKLGKLNGCLADSLRCGMTPGVPQPRISNVCERIRETVFTNYDAAQFLMNRSFLDMDETNEMDRGVSEATSYVQANVSSFCRMMTEFQCVSQRPQVCGHEQPMSRTLTPGQRVPLRPATRYPSTPLNRSPNWPQNGQPQFPGAQNNWPQNGQPQFPGAQNNWPQNGQVISGGMQVR